MQTTITVQTSSYEFASTNSNDNVPVASPTFTSAARNPLPAHAGYEKLPRNPEFLALCYSRIAPVVLFSALYGLSHSIIASGSRFLFKLFKNLSDANPIKSRKTQTLLSRVFRRENLQCFPHLIFTRISTICQSSPASIAMPRVKTIPTSATPAECPVCFKLLSRQSDLPRHIKIHSNKESDKFRCPVLDCAYWSTQKSNLNAHMRKGKHTKTSKSRSSSSLPSSSTASPSSSEWSDESVRTPSPASPLPGFTADSFVFKQEAVILDTFSSPSYKPAIFPETQTPVFQTSFYSLPEPSYSSQVYPAAFDDAVPYQYQQQQVDFVPTYRPETVFYQFGDYQQQVVVEQLTPFWHPPAGPSFQCDGYYTAPPATCSQEYVQYSSEPQLDASLEFSDVETYLDFSLELAYHDLTHIPPAPAPQKQYAFMPSSTPLYQEPHFALPAPMNFRFRHWTPN
ncbi:hypothetical protein C8J56DRAFT_949570 [Mycena floridula]|nr:hypothetical protein C8J56DRAFT_949570 [Mycena floridula]